MRLALVCLFLAAGVVRGQEPAAEPKQYGVPAHWTEGAWAEVPWERVKMPDKKKPSAELAGAQAKLRFVAGTAPELAIAFARAYQAERGLRLYRLETEGEKRVAPLGIWSYKKQGQAAGGLVPVKLEKFGRFSYKLKLPALEPGEYALANRGGDGAFTFGVDAK